MTDYALWTLGLLDGLVEKSSFPFRRSDYLCVAMFEVPKIQFFFLVLDWKIAFVIDFLDKVLAKSGLRVFFVVNLVMLRFHVFLFFADVANMPFFVADATITRFFG